MTISAERDDTWQACLTPGGAGAIATLALCGPRAWKLVHGQFSPSRVSGRGLPPTPELGRIWLGRLGRETKDQVVITVLALEPQLLVEVHCHGGKQAIGALIEGFEHAGVRHCSWQEFVRLAEPDPLRSSALVALGHAPTVRTANILLDQAQGSLRRAINALLGSWDRGESPDVSGPMDTLVRYANLGRHLTIPWRLVVAGPPNVGKSTLVNALAGFRRCIVDATPGTTRDMVSIAIAVDGWPVELTDTAGVREDAEFLEQQGIGLARRAASDADICLWLLDASAEPVEPDLAAKLLRRVINKIDLPAAWELTRASDAIRISAKTESGMDQLCQAMSRWLVPDPPPAGAPVPFTPALCDAVEEACRCYRAGRDSDAKLVLTSILKSGGSYATV